jgi:hypothetical protein
MSSSPNGTGPNWAMHDTACRFQVEAAAEIVAAEPDQRYAQT